MSARAQTRPPTDPTSGRWRLARAAGLGIAAYGLAVGAHVSAGGGWPGWPVGVMLMALLGVFGVAFTTRRRRLPALLGGLTAAQAALHALLSLLDAPASSCSVVDVGHHAATASCSPSPATTGSVAMAMPSPPMLVAQVAATAATAWVLARGKAWMWRTLRGVLAAPGAGPGHGSAAGLGAPPRGGAACDVSASSAPSASPVPVPSVVRANPLSSQGFRAAGGSTRCSSTTSSRVAPRCSRHWTGWCSTANACPSCSSSTTSSRCTSRPSRRWGYWALPVLHHDRLVGKVDATAARGAGVLRVDAVHEDVPFTATMTSGVRSQLVDLARWLSLALG